MKNIYVCRKMSKNNSPYVVMYVDLGYRALNLSYDMATIVEITGYTFEFVNNLEIDKPLHIANFSRVK